MKNSSHNGGTLRKSLAIVIALAITIVATALACTMCECEMLTGVKMWKRNHTAPNGPPVGEYVTEMYFYSKLPDGSKGPPIDNGSRWVMYDGQCQCPAENQTLTTRNIIIKELWIVDCLSVFSCAASTGKQLPWSGPPSGELDDSRQFERRVCYVRNDG
jgi:hypothetical protein